MRLTWSVPTRKSGRPFDAATEVDHYELAMRVQGAPDYTPTAAQPAATDTQFDIDVTDVGTYEFRLVCYPKTGAASDPAFTSAQILDQSAPVIATFTATV
jgi:hypothetical protein